MLPRHTVQTLLNAPTYEETTATHDEGDLNAIGQDIVKPALWTQKNTPKGLAMIQFPLNHGRCQKARFILTFIFSCNAELSGAGGGRGGLCLRFAQPYL